MSSLLPFGAENIHLVVGLSSIRLSGLSVSYDPFPSLSRPYSPYLFSSFYLQVPFPLLSIFLLY